MIDSNFPLKVICPECRVAIGARCTESKFSLGSAKQSVDWFHFARIDNATLNGLNQINSFTVEEMQQLREPK